VPRSPINLGRKAAWLDIGSYARNGPGRRDRLSPGHIAAITRTVRRAPEVMLKMLNDGGWDLGSVGRHLKYLDRGGELEIEMDDGEPLKGKGAALALIEDWGLDLDEKRRTADLKPRKSRQPPPKLVHKMIFSMPAGTPPEKVLAAAKNFAREEFGPKHRYAMVLHTDEPHPHVHLVVRAMGYDGQRLNIRKLPCGSGGGSLPGIFGSWGWQRMRPNASRGVRTGLRRRTASIERRSGARRRTGGNGRRLSRVGSAVRNPPSRARPSYSRPGGPSYAAGVRSPMTWSFRARWSSPRR
jgi:Relaxase/Mobilisation nuclease domain